MGNRKVYDLAADKQFQQPYVDKKELRERCGYKYTYVHGGFAGTDLRFAICYPEKANYDGRFFQYMPPAPNNEDASQNLCGGDDKITFAFENGGYFVESNMGVLNPFAPSASKDDTLTYRTAAQVAEYSRKIAKDIYGEDLPRPFGYIYGGSGGAYKTISCVENTDVFDGAVPYVNGAPVSVPHNLTIRAHAMRVLRHKLGGIIERLQPWCDGDMYAGLNAEEVEALKDLLEFGFPKKAICSLPFMKDGALPILVGGIKRGDPEYFEDFWEKEGYAGADKNSDAYKSRICHKTTVTGKYVPQKGEQKGMANTNGVDTNWQRYKGMSGALGIPLIEVADVPENTDFYVMGCFVNVLSGKAAGRKVYFGEWHDKTLAIHEYFGTNDMMEVMSLIEVGDEVLLDNSDYIAATDYHLHALPYEEYPGYSNCYDQNGKPKYVQRDRVVNFTGCDRQSGDFSCKMIIEAAFCDESAFPYQADWYKKLARQKGHEDNIRLQYIDNALHDDRAEPTFFELFSITNAAAIYQCLKDLVLWVEKGIVPPNEAKYDVKKGEMTYSESGKDRCGIQATCCVTSNGKKRVSAKVGEEVPFEVNVEIPKGAGELVNVEWSFEGEKDYPLKGLEKTASHVFEKKGTYVVCVRIYTERKGDKNAVFTKIPNIDRMVVDVIE